MQTILPQAHRSSAQGQYHHQLAAANSSWHPRGCPPYSQRNREELRNLQAGLAVDLAPEVAQQMHAIQFHIHLLMSVQEQGRLTHLCIVLSNIQHIVSSQLDENLLCQDETQFQPISSRPHRRGQFVR